MPYNFGATPQSQAITFGTQGGYNFTAGASSAAPTGMPGFLDKVGGFARSTIESFPELLGIEPTVETQTFRAQNPVSGLTSQLVGAFVPYLGAAKLARAAPLTGGFIRAAEGLGSGPITRGALGAASEAAVVEAGRLGIAATGLPEATYEGLTGRDAETRGLGQMGGESLINVGGSAILGGALGGLVARFAKGPRIEDYVPGAASDIPLVQQTRALNEIVSSALDEGNPLQLDEEVIARLARERDRRINWNLLDVEPTYTDTGETIRSGSYRQDIGKAFRPLVGERKSREVSNFLNRANNWRTASPDKLTATRRLVYDPTERGGYATADELAADLDAIGASRQDLGLFAQDIKTIEVRAGQGKQLGKPAEIPTPEQTLRNEFDQIWGVKQEGRGWVETMNGRVLGDSRAYGSKEEAVASIRNLVARDPEFRQLSWEIEPPKDVPSLTAEQALGRRLLEQPQEWNSTRDPLLGRARGLQRRFTSKPFRDVGDGWRLAKEEDGLYVMAKKLQGGAEAAPGDKWVFFRTDRPDVFAPTAARTNDIFMKSAYLPKPEDMLRIGDPIFDAGGQFLKETENVPLRKSTPATNKIAATARESVETLGTYAAPTAPLGTRNPLLNRAFQYLKHVESLAEARVDTLMRGARKFDPEKKLVRQVLTLDTPATEGLAQRIDELGPKDLADVRSVIEAEIPFEQVIELNARRDINNDPIISDAAKDFLQAMQLISDQFTSRMDNLSKALSSGEAIKLVGEFQARKGHYALTREFPGAYRYFLEDEGGRVIGMATGKSPLEAQEAAAKIIQDQAKKGKTVIMGGLIDEALRNPEAVQRLKQAVLRPGFLKNRGDLLGYELQRGELTNAKLRELVERNVKRRENYIRNVTVLEQLQETLATLKRTRPQDAIALEKRMNILQGDEGAFAQVQNTIMDKTLHAVGFSGKDTASSIVRTTQKLLTSFSFNFGSISQPILNILGTMQTIVPEISYVLHANPETLARNYVSLPLFDNANNLKGTMGLLSEWKVFGNAMEAMGKKWKDLPEDHRALIEEMIRQRQLAPRFAEEQFGVEGAILKDPTNMWKDTQSFVKYFEAANELMISKSEELNRMMVVNTAYELAKLMDLPFDRMVRFTRELMGKTAFNYSTVDRATVFTTPLGSLLGTFKNWMFHYMANMVKYATGGKEALPALFWQTAATAIIGGGAATPFFMPLANGASQFLADKKFMELLYSYTGGQGYDERVADGIMYGLPGVMGLSFSSQAAAPGANPARDASMIFSFAMIDRMKSLSSATKDALVAYRVAGESPWDDENVRGELVRALAPRTIYRAMSVMENNAVKSLATTYPVTGDLGLGGALAYAAGLNPVELEKTYEVYNQVRDDQNAQRAMVQELGQTLSQAYESGDDRLANRVYARATALGIDVSSVLRSAESRNKRQQETQLDFAASPEQEEQFSFMFNDAETGP